MGLRRRIGGRSRAGRCGRRASTAWLRSTTIHPAPRRGRGGGAEAATYRTRVPPAAPSLQRLHAHAGGQAVVGRPPPTSDAVIPAPAVVRRPGGASQGSSSSMARTTPGYSAQQPPMGLISAAESEVAASRIAQAGLPVGWLTGLPGLAHAHRAHRWPCLPKRAACCGAFSWGDLTGTDQGVLQIGRQRRDEGDAAHRSPGWVNESSRWACSHWRCRPSRAASTGSAP